MDSTDLYLLPSSPSFTRQDRFSLTDSDADDVPFFDILKCILRPIRTVDELIDQLDTIAVTLHGRSLSSYDGLRHFLRHDWDFDRFASKTYIRLIKLALNMSDLYPEGTLPVLRAGDKNVFSRSQIACLVIHQFLCTLPAPPWMEAGGGISNFHIWYPSGEDLPHPLAVRAYLTSLFTYFERVSHEDDFLDVGHPISFSLCSLPKESGPRIDKSLGTYTPFGPCELEIIPQASNDPAYLGLQNGASVISCNKQIGFGRTGTQEEVHVGTSLEACPIVIMVPPLEETQAVVVRGAESMAVVYGFGRDAKLEKVLRKEPEVDWSCRTMLFMDALELDGHDNGRLIPDLLPGNLERELRKAYTAFSSIQGATTLFTGLWGCGSFGGNASVKTVLQWAAASYAGVSLVIICQPDRLDFIEDFQRLSDTVRKNRWSVEDVLQSLATIKPNADTILQPLKLVLNDMSFPHGVNAAESVICKT